jgi:hypothetical protein
VPVRLLLAVAGRLLSEYAVGVAARKAAWPLVTSSNGNSFTTEMQSISRCFASDVC